MAFVRILSKLLKDKKIGKRVVPIVPDEARTFGMDRCSAGGHLQPEGPALRAGRRDQLLYYKEATDGQMLEEGITEAGSMSFLDRRGDEPTRRTAGR
jgi:pyruvate dehydrogenase E1 component